MKSVSARLLPFLLILASYGSPSALAATAPAAPELTKLLHEFLSAAGTNDRAVFDSFFAEDAIYTRSAGVTISKADIMKSLGEPRKGNSPASSYDADDITVHQYGDCAIVNFRLIAKSGEAAPQYYRNTGTFVKQDGKWRVVAWQSTKAAEATAK